MGLIDGLGKAALKSLGEKLTYAGASVSNAIINNVIDSHTSKSIISQHPEFSHLIIKQKIFTLGEKYNIYDENQNIKYKVKGKLRSNRKKLKIYNSKGKEVAKVYEKHAFRNPLSLKAPPLTFMLVIGGKKIGKLKINYAKLRPICNLDCCNWTIEGEVWSRNYTIYDNGFIVMRMLFSDWADLGDAYVLEFPDPEIETLGLLVAVTLESLNKSDKSDQIKRKLRI